MRGNYGVFECGSVSVLTGSNGTGEPTLLRRSDFILDGKVQVFCLLWVLVSSNTTHSHDADGKSLFYVVRNTGKIWIVSELIYTYILLI